MINGFYKIVGSSELIGWASDISRPNDQVTVEILIGGAIVGSAIADGIRPDVASSGLGVMKSGFYFRFNDKNIDKESQLEVRCKLPDSPAVLIRKNVESDGISSDKAANPQNVWARGPIFIVGSPRSGTSAMVDAVSAAGYSGFREGNFLSLIYEMRKIVEKHYSLFYTTNAKVMINHIDRDDLVKKLASVLMKSVIELNHGTAWFDKTGNPAMIRALPIISKLLPSAVFVFCKRRALENIASRIKKFPSQTFEFHCSDWAENMRSWREVRQDLNPGSYLEVEQNNMIYKPNETAGKMAEFLCLSKDKEKIIVEILKSTRPQETEAGSSSRVVSMSAIGWSEESIRIFLHNCKSEMDLFGYSLDEKYML